MPNGTTKDSKMQQPHPEICVRVPQELLDQLDAAVVSTDLNRSQIVRRSLIEWLSTNELLGDDAIKCAK
jgi:metal-responsive CopG/Arc/MetJ family transcriptional regulator